MSDAAENITLPEITEPEINQSTAAELGLKSNEYDHILKILDRTPTWTELGVFSAMWSEHCSYKSSRIHLKKLPTTAPWVIQGPGENAGVIDIGDGQAAVFKMESHNHPSFIEPYQGAATGVGGIMRDIFTMGARPVANLNALRFGAIDHPKTKHLVAGVVKGIGDYGNCVGVPTVGGEVNFHAAYNGNILVNAMTVGIADADKIFYARGASAGQPVVYVGSRTGRDGIHGATMASASFDDDSDQQRPTVQVGDPFTEKLLLEACLELMNQDAIISIQDMGAAGLTSSSVEIAAKGEIGVHLDLDSVPQRETNMSPYEIMLSESQERMLMILKPGKEDTAREVFEKWDLEFAVIGQTIPDRRLILDMHGRRWCDIPVPPLVDDAPVYDRPYKTAIRRPEVDIQIIPKDQPRKIDHIEDALKTLLSCPDLMPKNEIWEQYDRYVGGETVFTSGEADAAVVKVGPHKALAMASDCTPRYCFADPFEGGKQAVAESWRNLCAVGAKPLAVTNNLNFGNPERPEIMAQFAGCIEGMADACRALDYPVISGNVSLYNETNGKGILPTPVIGGVGLLDSYKTARGLKWGESESVFVIGETKGHLGRSLYLREILGREEGEPPPVDLETERRNGEFVRTLILEGLITACHDVSDGGLLVALAEMAKTSGKGIDIRYDPADAAFWFGEDQARYVVSTQKPEKLKDLTKEYPVLYLGQTLNNNNGLKFKETLFTF